MSASVTTKKVGVTVAPRSLVMTQKLNGTITTTVQKPKIPISKPAPPPPAPLITKKNELNNDSLLPQDRPQLKVTGSAASQLTNVALPDISVLQVEKKDKNSPPVTKIIIYKSKDPNKKPTAKLIIEKNEEYGNGYEYASQSVPSTPTSSNTNFNTYSAMMQKPHSSYYSNENKRHENNNNNNEATFTNDDQRIKLPWSDDSGHSSGIYGPSQQLIMSSYVHPSNHQGNYDPYNPYSMKPQSNTIHNLNLDEHLIDPYRENDPYYVTNTVKTPYQHNYQPHTQPQQHQLPGTPLNISQLNLTSNELYNADINYMNNYLKSLPDYNLLATTSNNNNSNAAHIAVGGESDSNNNFNYPNYAQYPLSKSNSFQSFNLKPQLYHQYQNQPISYENVMPASQGLSRSTSSHAIPHHHPHIHHHHHHTHVQTPLQQFIGQQNSMLSQHQPMEYQGSNSGNVIGGEGLCTRPPSSGTSSKPSISEFWKENLNSSNKQPKVGWNYNKIMSKTKDELQNTINRYKNNIASLNNSLMGDSSGNESNNPFKLRKNYSYTNVDTHLRDQLKKENPYEMMYYQQKHEKQPHYMNYQESTAPFSSHANSAFTPVGDFNPISSTSSNYSLNSLYSPVQPAELSYTNTNTTPPPPPGFKSLMKSMSNASMPSYLNSNPIPFGYHLQKSSSKISHIPVPVSKGHALSKSSSNSTIMQLPSVNLAELSSYLPHNLSKSSSSSCIYAKTLNQAPHLRKTNDIFASYKGFDVSEANKTVAKNTELLRNEHHHKKPAISLKPSNSFSGGTRPNVIFQRPIGAGSFTRPKASTPIAKCVTDANIPPNENLPPASFSGERIHFDSPLDYSMKYHEKQLKSNDCIVNIEDNIGRSIADIYDVGNNYHHIYGSSPTKKPSVIPFDYKSNLNPEAKNFTPLSKSSTVKYVPFNFEKYKSEIKTPPESSYLSSPHLVRKIMRSNTINFNNNNNSQTTDKAQSFIVHEKFSPLRGNVTVSQSTQQNIRDTNNNNSTKTDSYTLKSYQEDILRQFDPYFNASTAVNDTGAITTSNNSNVNNTTSTSNMTILNNTNISRNMSHDIDNNSNKNASCSISSKSKVMLRHASSSDLFLDCDDEPVDENDDSDLLDDADLDADDEDEGAAGISSTAESVSEYLQSCGYPFKKSKKYSHQFSQSNSNDGSKLQISGTDESPCCTPGSGPNNNQSDEVF